MQATVTTDRSRLDIDFIHTALAASYWAKGIPRQVVERSIAGSLCFGVFLGERQVGFARVISDFATFAYLADVIVDEDERGKGHARALMDAVMAHPDLQGLRRFALATRDAHGLYAKYGFTPLRAPDVWMEIHRADNYTAAVTDSAP